MDIRELLDRQEISDVLYDYARGIDRLDWDLVRRCFHPDAHDDHGFFKGDIDTLIEYCASDVALGGFLGTLHYMGHQQIEVEGNVARAETYCLAHHRVPDTHAWGPAMMVIGLRYVDRFERREGRWAIASRICTYEWASRLPIEDNEEFFPAGTALGRRDADDTLYTVVEDLRERFGRGARPTTA